MRTIVIGLVLAACLSLAGNTSSSSPPGTVAIPSPGLVTIQAAGRGTPYVSFADGRAIPASFSNAASPTSLLSEPATKGLALASADFDEDGMPDLVASYETSKGGLIGLHPGNADAVYPNAPEAREHRKNGTYVGAPFLPDAKLFETPEKPDFIGAGDFDADGHWDVVAARRGGTTLSFHRGDGAGGLLPPENLPLPGAVSTLATGDVNRRDGLEDVLVGVTTPTGPKLLVFEGPVGALQSEPESLDLPAPATRIVTGQLAGDYTIDIAVAAGNHLVIVTGRDRKLSFPEEDREQVGVARMSTVALPFTLHDLALGDFDADRTLDLATLADDGGIRVANVDDLEGFAAAPPEPFERIDPSQARRARLMSAHVSSVPGQDLVLAGGMERAIMILNGAASPPAPGEPSPVASQLSARPLLGSFDTLETTAAVLPMRLDSDALADLVVLSGESATLSHADTTALTVLTVTNTNDSGAGSLRQAILDANATPGADTIAFNIPGAGPHTIQPTTELPDITEAVTVDATTDPDYSGTPVVYLSGDSLAPSPLPSGLTVQGEPSVIRGLSVGAFGWGIVVSTPTGGNIVEGNHVGVDPTGMLDRGNVRAGIAVSSGGGDLVGGTTAAARNVASGNNDPTGSSGITVEGGDGHRIVGNYIGADISGSGAIPNGSGIVIGGGSSPPANITIGGTGGFSGNLVSGNDHNGIQVSSGSGTLIQQNYVGTNFVGSTALTNWDNGIALFANTTVGGTTSSAKNRISGNGTGVSISAGGSMSTIQGNWIGTSDSGIVAIPNGIGVWVNGNDVLIGTASGSRNVISGNTGPGIQIGSASVEPTGNVVIGNFIGLSTNGLFALGNGLVGIDIFTADDNRIGGTNTAAANVISANSRGGIRLRSGADLNLIQMNLIGTDPTGALMISPSNGPFGIEITDSRANTIGVKQGQGNIIVGSEAGVHIGGAPSTNGNIIQGNRIGTDITGTVALPNTDGIVIDGSVSDNVIGGDLLSTGNLIAGNSGSGIILKGDSESNTVIGNLVGTDISGTIALGNNLGIVITENARISTIGGPAAANRNIVSANGNNLVDDAASAGNLIEGNYFGTDISGAAPLGIGASDVAFAGAFGVQFTGNVVGGNHTRGVRVISGSNIYIEDNMIGVGPGMVPIGLSGPGILIEGSSVDPLISGNVIMNNADDAIQINGTTTGGLIIGNSIQSNAGLGIDLGPDGVTPNDAGDGDSGPNSLQNFPVLATADATGGNVIITGALNSTPSSLFNVYFYASPSCDPSGYGEGASELGGISLMTDASGNAAITADLTAPVFSGDTITALAHDFVGGGNSSEFSACITATGVAPTMTTLIGFDTDVGTSLSWDPIPGADYYTLYRGTGLTLPFLGTPDADSCERLASQSTSTGPAITEVPAPGDMDWFLLTGSNSYGEGSAGVGRQLDSTGACPPPGCSHDKCTAGASLDATCGQCVSDICSVDSYCCDTQWDSICIEEVRTLCGSLSCSESTGQCAHSQCAEGGTLAAGCDDPPVSPSCVSQVCQADSYCCQTAWDSVCVGEVASVCGYNCN